MAAPHSIDGDGAGAKVPAAANANDKTPMKRDVMAAARFSLLSLRGQTIGRIAMRYEHKVDMHTTAVAFARLKECVYGPRFALMHRYSQTFVMAHETGHHMLGHIPQGALLYKLSPKSFSFKAYNIACDAVINAICESLPNEKNTSASAGIVYAVRRCQEMGIIDWDDLKIRMTKIAQKGGVELDETFTKPIGEVNSIQIYNAMMRTIRRRAAERRGAREERSANDAWASLAKHLQSLVSAAIDDPSIVFITDPIELGAVDLHDAIADLVRTYTGSEAPADHEGRGPIPTQAFGDLLDAVGRLIAAASANALHVFTTKPVRRAHALSLDLLRIIRAFDPKGDRKPDEEQLEDSLDETEETIIDQLADEMNAHDDLREAIEEASKKSESDLNNEVARKDSEMRKHQSTIGSGDALKQVCPPGGKTMTPWKGKIRRLMSSALIAKMSLNPTRPSRRTVSATYEAMRRGVDRSHGSVIMHQPHLKRRTEARKFFLIMDTSGSVFTNRELLGRFVQEAETVGKTFNCTMTIVFADAEVCEVVEIGEAMHVIRTLKPKGGGATDFRPAIALAEESKPDAIIYLTDLCGTFPEKKPKCPIIWAYPSEYASVPTPYGQRLELA